MGTRHHDGRFEQLCDSTANRKSKCWDSIDQNWQSSCQTRMQAHHWCVCLYSIATIIFNQMFHWIKCYLDNENYTLLTNVDIDK